MYKRHHFMLMSALGVALSAGAGAVAAAYDSAEKFVVTGALKATHFVTEQVCDFDTLDQLENFLANVADRHDWFRHDQPAAAAALEQIAQVEQESAAISQGDIRPVTVNLDLDQLRAGASPADSLTISGPEAGGQATAQLDAAGSPMRNPHFGGQFEGETIEEAEARRAAANVAQQPAATEEPAAGAAPEAPASIELPATPTDTAA